MNLLLNPQTKRQTEAFLSNVSHALIIAAPTGSGKGTLANQIVADLLEIDTDKVKNHPHVLKVAHVGQGIGIDEIRHIQGFLKLKTTGGQPIRRAVIVENSQTMTVEAQNAFLKILEEPPKDTIIILTVKDEKTLLPTVTSRCQIIRVQPVSLKVAQSHMTTDNDFEKNYFMSGGRMGLLSSLSDELTDNSFASDIAYAKQLIRLNTYERLTQADGILKDKDRVEALLEALERVFHAGLLQAGKAGNNIDIKRWQRALKQIINSRQALAANAQPKLLVTDLLLNLV